MLTAGQAMAADYTIDKEGQHAFIDWKISHLGYSYIHGTFKDWDGTFSWDAAKPEAHLARTEPGDPAQPH